MGLQKAFDCAYRRCPGERAVTSTMRKSGILQLLPPRERIGTNMPNTPPKRDPLDDATDALVTQSIGAITEGLDGLRRGVKGAVAAMALKVASPVAGAVDRGIDAANAAVRDALSREKK